MKVGVSKNSRLIKNYKCKLEYILAGKGEILSEGLPKLDMIEESSIRI